MARTMRPDLFHALVALFLVLGLALSLMLGARLPWAWPWLLLAWLAGTTVVAFGYYGWDKRQALNGGRRVPEAVLHGLAVAGGSLGAYAGMRWFRHKTIKGPFQIFFWSVAVLQVVLVAVVVWRLVNG
ncbi:MAG: DUF1294 domain-containing protein [Gemmataceae bacterium]|nr:DUF1294 domain-containing protein [Gemmataceae bacterium]